MPPVKLQSAIEALLFSSDQPLPLTLLCEALEAGPEEVGEALHRLGEDYAARDAGIELREIAGGWMLVTTSEQAEWVGRMLRGKRKMRLSRAALESMAIIAYKQPVTKSEVEAIRGVDSSAVLATLLERNLVTIRGRSKVVGRPLLYGTTQEFLEYFGLKDLSELPRPEELRALVAAREPEQLDMMELEVVSQVASDLAASEAAHPELITRHEIVPAGAADVVQPATQVATDFAAADDAALSDLVPPAAEADAEAEEEESDVSPSLFADRE
jgi:segregation and condensation protein B